MCVCVDSFKFAKDITRGSVGGGAEGKIPFSTSPLYGPRSNPPSYTGGAFDPAIISLLATSYSLGSTDDHCDTDDDEENTCHNHHRASDETDSEDDEDEDDDDLHDEDDEGEEGEDGLKSAVFSKYHDRAPVLPTEHLHIAEKLSRAERTCFHNFKIASAAGLRVSYIFIL
jgi:hypothetical protein